MRRSFDSLRSLRMTLDESGVVQLIPLLIILAGIIASVYLVQKSGYQIFKPQAAAENINFSAAEGKDASGDPCRVYDEGGKLKTNCPAVNIKFISPLETKGSSDAGPNMSLVKTAYADSKVEGGYCKEDKIYYKVTGVETVHSFCRSGYKCMDVEGGAQCVKAATTPDQGGEGWSCIENNTTLHKDDLPWLPFFGHTNIKCPSDKPVCKQEGNSASCVGKEPSAKAPSATDQPIAYFCVDNKITASYANGSTKQIFECTGDNPVCVQKIYPTKESPGVAICDDKPTAPAGAPAAPATPPQPAPERPTGGSSAVNCQDNPPGERPQGYKWVADCQKSCIVRLGTKDPHSDCPKNTTSGYVNPKTSNWCYGFINGPRCLKLVYEGETAAPAGAPAAPGSKAPAPKEPAGVGTTEPKQPQKEQPKEAAQKVTKSYRFSDKSADLEGSPWKPYTQGGVSQPHTFDSKPGLKYIWYQFLVLENGQEKIYHGNPQIGQIELVKAGSTETETDKETGKDIVSGDCPLSDWKSYDIPTLKQKCNLSDQAKLPVDALKDFSNQDLLEIAKKVDGRDGPYYFLDKFNADRLGTFDLTVLKKLPESTIKKLPQALQDTIKGKGTTSSEKASCTSISISKESVFNATVKFTGSPSSLKIWLASNSDKGEEVKDVGSWSLVKTISNPTSGTLYEITPSGFDKGTHAVLMSLHGSIGQMLDGNPNGIVNSSCASSVDIQ